jgi:hypothetical protein
MKRFRAIRQAVSLCLAILMGLAAGAQADSFLVYEGAYLGDPGLFGNLSQQEKIITDVYGNYGCPPTAIVNNFVYLQNQYPALYGTTLVSGYDATSMANTALTLGGSNYMNGLVTKNGNVISTMWYYTDMVWGLNLYSQAQAPGRSVYAAQMYPGPRTGPGSWTTARPQPNWVTMSTTSPTEAFLYNALSQSQTLVIAWNQVDSNGQIMWTGAGHVLTVTGLTWDSSTTSGTLYYIDPKGGMPHNSPFWLAANGSLWIDYGEINGVPWKRQDKITDWWYSGYAQITVGLAEGPAPVPLPATLLLLGSGLLGLTGLGRRWRKS